VDFHSLTSNRQFRIYLDAFPFRPGFNSSGPRTMLNGKIFLGFLLSAVSKSRPASCPFFSSFFSLHLIPPKPLPTPFGRVPAVRDTFRFQRRLKKFSSPKSPIFQVVKELLSPPVRASASHARTEFFSNPHATF